MFFSTKYVDLGFWIVTDMGSTFLLLVLPQNHSSLSKKKHLKFVFLPPIHMKSIKVVPDATNEHTMHLLLKNQTILDFFKSGSITTYKLFLIQNTSNTVRLFRRRYIVQYRNPQMYPKVATGIQP